MNFLRDLGWFLIYYPGFLVLIIFCVIYVVKNPDPIVWYGKVDFNSRLYPTKEAAEADNAEEIENVHKTFIWWFFFCAINLFCMIIIGIPRHFNERF